MFESVIEKPLFRPNINIGGMFDIPTGKYELGKHGESILNGGIGPLTGIASRPNNFKTALAVYMQAMIRRACPKTHGLTYDTEGTLSAVSRFTAISMHYKELKDINYEADTQYIFTDMSRYSGDNLFKLFKDTMNQKAKDGKKHTVTTPFVGKDGKLKVALYPTSLLIDSFSRFQIAAVEENIDKVGIADSKMNKVPMDTGKAKFHLMNSLPTLTAQTGSYVILTAHVGDVINLDMYPTDKRNLSHMKKDTTIKGVSPGFYTLPHNVWSIETNKPLVNKDKLPLYPLDSKNVLIGDSDLKILEVQNLRGKNGITGMLMPLIVSQTEGYLPSLTEFHYVKTNEFGIGGNDRNYYLELLPEVSLTRTTVRSKLNDNALLRRAVEIQSEMLQLIQFHRTDQNNLFTDPKTLYAELKEMGYDWNQLLNTRGYYVFKEDESDYDKPFLSTMDLLRMRKGLYVPYWLNDREQQLKKVQTFIGGKALGEK